MRLPILGSLPKHMDTVTLSNAARLSRHDEWDIVGFVGFGERDDALVWEDGGLWMVDAAIFDRFLCTLPSGWAFAAHLEIEVPKLRWMLGPTELCDDPALVARAIGFDEDALGTLGKLLSKE